MKKLRVAVIGTGYLGQIHARIYHELEQCELIGICDRDKKKKSLADQYGVPFFRDHTQLLDQVDAVSIAVPTAYHYAVAKDFLNHDIHTLIEKPVTLNLEDADELIEIAKQKNLVMQVGHLERYNAAFKAAKKILKQPRFIEIHRLGPFTGRINDCGVVLDLMIHDIDIVLGLVRSEVDYIDSVGINVLTAYEDIANVRVGFKNGCITNFTASRLTPDKQRKIRIFQDDAYISLDYGNQSAEIFRKKLFSITKEKIDIQKEEPLKNEIVAFLESISTGSGKGKPDVDAREALALALRIVEDIKERNKKLPFLANK